MTWDEVLWERSFINIMMLGRSIPNYEDEKDGKKSQTVIKKEVASGADLFNRFKK